MNKYPHIGFSVDYAPIVDQSSYWLQLSKDERTDDLEYDMEAPDEDDILRQAQALTGVHEIEFVEYDS